MRFLLIAVSTFVLANSFPMCTDGQTPLMEANDAFTCDRGCPVGFNCEFQDAQKSLNKAICCANMTALQMLYGDEEHSEPIWDLSEVASLSLGLQAPSDEATTTTVQPTKEYKAPSITPPPNFHEIPEESSAEISTTTDNILLPPETEVFSSSSSTLSSTTQILLESSTIESTISAEKVEEIVSTTARIENLEETGSHISPEMSEIEVGSGEMPSEELNSTLTSCERQKFRIFCHGGKLRTLATLRWFWNEEKGECEFYPFGYCPGDRIVESTTLRTKMDCERRCSGKDVSANFEEKEELIELITPSSIDTSENQTIAVFSEKIGEEKKQETNEISTVKEQIDEEINKDQVENNGNTEKEPTKEEIMEAISSATGEKSNAIHPNEGSVDGTTEEPTHIEIPAAERAEENAEDRATAPLETDENGKESAPLETAGNAEETTTTPLRKHETLTSNDIEKTLPSEEIPTINDIGDTSTRASEQESTTTGVAAEKSSSEESSESDKGSDSDWTENTNGIVAAAVPSNRPTLMCSATSYRYTCTSGMPSQFVYRWEMVDGKCQSFPYGYCYGEFNHGHPRTPEECYQLCSPIEHQFFAL